MPSSTTHWLLFLGGLCALALVLHLYYRYTIKRSAREMNDEMDERAARGPRIVDADPAEFTWLDLDFYDRVRDDLIAHGFRPLGDFENLTETELTPYLRRFNRVLVSADGSIAANILMIRVIRSKMPLLMRWIPVPPVRNLELSSKTVDGVRLSTTNAKGVVPEVDLPGLIIQYHEPDMPVPVLLQIHRDAMDEIIRADPDIPFEVCLDREQMVALWIEEHEWMKSCDAYHKIAAESAAAQAQGDDEKSKAGRDIYKAYLIERERRRAVLARMAQEPNLD